MRNRLKLFAMPALMLALSACGEPNQVDEPANEPGVGEYTEEAAADAGEIAEDVGEAVAKSAENTTNAIGEAIQKEIDDINALGMTARNILDVEVRTRKGEVAARVDDLLFTRAGEPALAVLSEGGIFGVGDDLVLVTVQRFIMTEDELGDVSIVMTLTDEELEALGDGISYLPADFSVGGEVDTSLLSARKILDAAIYNPEGEKVADMYDFILGREWNIDSAILSDGGLADIGDRLVRIDWSAISMAADNASFETTPTTPDFDTLPRFEYGQLLER